MNTDQIAYLIDIAKTGSINTTAKRMFSSQQAVSEAIKRMEQELNCTILERSKRGVSLTENGKFVLQHIIPMMEQYHILQHHFREDSSVPSGRLNIAVAFFAASTILADIVFKMYRTYPEITLHTRELWTDEIIDGLLQGEIDFGIAGFSDDSEFSLSMTQALYQDRLIIQPLYSDYTVCIMHKNNPLASQKEISLELIEQTKQTQYNLPMYQNNDRYLHISNNTAIHKKFMQEENTICLISNQLFKKDFPEPEFVAVPIAGSATVDTCLLYRKQESPESNGVYQAFIKTATEVTGRLHTLL